LNGVISATTPSGWRKEYTSIPVRALSAWSPLRRSGMPVAISTTSRPLDVSAGVGQRLAGLAREERGELVHVRLGQLEEPP
jgi:hypothetical protein